jgi:glutamate-1-semialdehyde 2,1-aminomutase
MNDPRYAQSHALFERAAAVVPGGIYGHMSPSVSLAQGLPQFASRAEGCHYWDADGNRFIDFMCGYGPIVLGANHPEIEEAADKQRRDGNCFNHPTARFVELAERMTALVDFAAWAVFAKNGADVTTWSIQVAREFTKRKKVISIQQGYHGTHAWCSPGHGGLIEEDRAHIHSFRWNDLQGFHDLIKKHRGEIAAFISGPFHYASFADQEMPAPGFWTEIERVCRQEGIVMILDDIRAGFRLHLGGSHRVFGFTPDLICFCKALGNGHPISAALGHEKLRVAASRVFLTGSYWNSAVPMAAALKCLEILERDQVIPALEKIGRQLMDGLVSAAQANGWKARVSGPPAIPFLTLENDPGFHQLQRWSVAAARHGAYFHPHHNWFVCAAHTSRDIDEAIEAARKAFTEIAQA